MEWEENIKFKHIYLKNIIINVQGVDGGEINKYTNKIPLEIEHIDGNYKNNNEENLILLCPNCHSLTSTYKGANLNNGRKSRSKYNKERVIKWKKQLLLQEVLKE